MSESSEEEIHLSDNEVDPTEIFTMDDYLQRQNAWNAAAAQLATDLMSSLGPSSSRQPGGTRRYMERNRVAGNARLIVDYFCDNPVYNDQDLRRRFRMRRPLFLRIVNALGEWPEYFTQRVDGIGRLGLSPLQKCTAVNHMLAYAASADQCDKYVRIGTSTSLESLKLFCEGVIEIFGPEYMRSPTVEDTQRLLQIHGANSFLGMLGSIDCMHWKWKNCPNGWKGMYTRGDYGSATIILEAVASHDRWIWHAYFGVAGSNNDINVINQSPVFTDLLWGRAPRVSFIVNGRQYDKGYYLADGIYPKWATLMKTIKLPQTAKQRLFAGKQEYQRKDVECAFGILKARFKIIVVPCQLWKKADIGLVMRACIIMHNMIIEAERGMDVFDLNDDPGEFEVEGPAYTNDVPRAFAQVISTDCEVHDAAVHNRLKKDLIGHIWEYHRGSTSGS